MFNINDHKWIIEKYWTKAPEIDAEKAGFKAFENDFAINAGFGFHSKPEN